MTAYHSKIIVHLTRCNIVTITHRIRAHRITTLIATNSLRIEHSIGRDNSLLFRLHSIPPLYTIHHDSNHYRYAQIGSSPLETKLHITCLCNINSKFIIYYPQYFRISIQSPIVYTIEIKSICTQEQ